MMEKLSICSNCGVELEADMEKCPLCQQIIGIKLTNQPTEKWFDDIDRDSSHTFGKDALGSRAKTFIWEILSIVLLTAIVSTMALNLIINKHLSWSVYPVAASCILFSYFSMFAFWKQRTWLRMFGGLVISTLFLIAIYFIAGSPEWIFQIVFPLLFVSNILVAIFIKLIHSVKYKGLNLIAYGFIGATLLCISTEAIITLYKYNQIKLLWSMIVSANTLIIVIVLLFMHLRLKRGRDLRKTFHI